jgi:hypothetical protein
VTDARGEALLLLWVIAVIMAVTLYGYGAAVAFITIGMRMLQ